MVIIVTDYLRHYGMICGGSASRGRMRHRFPTGDEPPGVAVGFNGLWFPPGHRTRAFFFERFYSHEVAPPLSAFPDVLIVSGARHFQRGVRR